jgi:GNAT superfamily N-acetyltransferase
MSLTAEGVGRRQLEFIRGYIEWLGRASERAEAWERPGVSAAMVPIAAERSIVNSVIAESTLNLTDAYSQLSEAYREAGIVAWTVWTHEEDNDAQRFLEENGHVFDGAPVAMALDLAAWKPEDLGDLDWDAEAEFGELGRINDLAYGYEPDTGMAKALLAPADEMAIRLYRARVEDEVACVLGTLDVGDDAGILFVATPPELRGRRLASRLLTAALLDARERGMRTSSLQASALGSPIYERLGYRTHFRFHLMERRFEHQAQR